MRSGFKLLLLITLIVAVLCGDIQLTTSEKKYSLVEVDYKNLQERLVLAEREIVHLKEEACDFYLLYFTVCCVL